MITARIGLLVRLMQPESRRSYQYQIFESGKLLGDVYVLNPSFINVIKKKKGLRCVRVRGIMRHRLHQS